MELISMTKYVLSNSNWYGNKYHRITQAYANFLNTELSLGMFIPCDLEGNVLEEPKAELSYLSFYNIRLKQFQEAKSRVLFEGVVNNNDGTFKPTQSTYVIKDFFRMYKTIEDLTHLGLTLTQTSINKLK